MFQFWGTTGQLTPLLSQKKGTCSTLKVWGGNNIRNFFVYDKLFSKNFFFSYHRSCHYIRTPHRRFCFNSYISNIHRKTFNSYISNIPGKRFNSYISDIQRIFTQLPTHDALELFLCFNKPVVAVRIAWCVHYTVYHCCKTYAQQYRHKTEPNE